MVLYPLCYRHPQQFYSAQIIKQGNLYFQCQLWFLFLVMYGTTYEGSVVRFDHLFNVGEGSVEQGQATIGIIP